MQVNFHFAKKALIRACEYTLSEAESMTDDTETLSSNIKGLREEVARFNRHKFVRIHDSYWKLMWFQFLRGLAFGFGSVAGATILVSIVGYVLNQMEVVPIVGEWAKQMATEIMNETAKAGAGQ
tara:strand:- start:6266 stop:6637 length:372 start_codon:yes stop_codon:yes gene_type:complete